MARTLKLKLRMQLPIWPEGVTENWPIEEHDAESRKKGGYLELAFDLPPAVDDETAQQLIHELYENLNDSPRRSRRQQGGSGQFPGV
jgi:hypothetical protein